LSSTKRRVIGLLIIEGFAIFLLAIAAIERHLMKKSLGSILTIAVVLVGVGVVAQRGGGTPPVNGQCPPGMTLVRVGSCGTPEFPPPSIVDYRPKSPPVTATNMPP